MAENLTISKRWLSRYQPDSDYTYSFNPGYTISQRRLAFYVGVVALGLPIILVIGAVLGPRTCFYDSISHFYYAKFLGGIFIAALVFIGTFLLAYRGENKTESTLANFAGVFALSVALFPTNGRGCDMLSFSGRALADFRDGRTLEFVQIVNTTRAVSGLEVNPFFELFSGAQYIHGASAAALFLFIAWYSFVVFTRVKEGNLTTQKRRRNRIYMTSGVVIVISIIAIVIGHYLIGKSWNDYNLTFWFESVALIAFGVSWIVKGQTRWAYLRDESETQNESTHS